MSVDYEYRKIEAVEIPKEVYEALIDNDYEDYAHCFNMYSENPEYYFGFTIIWCSAVGYAEETTYKDMYQTHQALFNRNFDSELEDIVKMTSNDFFLESTTYQGIIIR